MSDRKVVRVHDVMKTQFDIVDGMSTVHNALSAMKYTDTKCLIVDKRHEDDEFGILLISDIARKVLAKDRSFDRVNVYEVMTKPVLSVDKDMDIRYCARMFDRFDISRAPVVDCGNIMGVVSYTDLILRGLYTNE